MKTLYLLRHAKAEPGGRDIADPDRTLSGRGREASDAIGAYIKARKYLPDCVLSSPSARTRETLGRALMAAGLEPQCRFENTLYLATAEEILRLLQGGVGDKISSVMVVGHNPGMHHIALGLSDPRRTALRMALELKFPTCAFAVLRFDVGHWEKIALGQGTLVDFVVPGEL